MSKNYYTDYTQDGYPIKELKSKYGELPHRICDICKDDGLCRNNRNNSSVKESDGYFDCILYLKRKCSL